MNIFRNTFKVTRLVVIFGIFSLAYGCNNNQTKIKIDQNDSVIQFDSLNEIIWHVKAYHPDVKLLDVKAIDKEGNIYDVKAIQNVPVGVCDFWSKAFLNHNIGAMISEKDRPILGYLTNIEMDLHTADLGEGYDLIFTFSPNSYFDGT